jgi:hypothetical protein
MKRLLEGLRTVGPLLWAVADATFGRGLTWDIDDEDGF